jgi:hypothetical protein
MADKSRIKEGRRIGLNRRLEGMKGRERLDGKHETYRGFLLEI